MCNYELKYWNNGLAEGDWGGINLRTLDDYSLRNLKFYITEDKDIGSDLILKRGELKSYEINQYRHKVKTGQRLLVINLGGELGRFAIGGLPWY